MSKKIEKLKIGLFLQGETAGQGASNPEAKQGV
jgi:hypothetical protein